MTEIKNQKLLAVYNGNETIANNGFTMQSRFLVPMLTRMNNEGLINQSAFYVVQTIFSFKHNEKNPYPTNEKLAEWLGVDIETIKKAMKSIRKVNLINILKVVDEKTGKNKRNNQYDFSPLFALLEKFIIECTVNNNWTVKIADLMKVAISKVVKPKTSESKEASKLDKLPKVKKEVVKVEVEEVQEAPSETLQDAPQDVEQLDDTKLPPMLEKACTVLKVDAEGVQAVKDAYALYGEHISEEIFLSKIQPAITKGKKNFASYYMKCIFKAYTDKETIEPAPKKQTSYNATKKPIREEKVPEWFYNRNNPQPKETPVEELIPNMNMEELLKQEKAVNTILEIISNHKQSLHRLELIEKRKAELLA